MGPILKMPQVQSVKPTISLRIFSTILARIPSNATRGLSTIYNSTNVISLDSRTREPVVIRMIYQLCAPISARSIFCQRVEKQITRARALGLKSLLYRFGRDREEMSPRCSNTMQMYSSGTILCYICAFDG